ncbi:MAG: ribose 5-phosphate isomerase B [Candidatus Omnitrophica bacterium]|jgi:ribose 5-phosphate isomerase B|nr:ribose 5-phosphate isomerase B [Candidatus Omnitrophota bacterium]
MKKIIIGSDHGGFALKESLKPYLIKSGYKVKDVGAYSEESCDYPSTASAVAREVSSGRLKQGILICKSGIGNSIVANKFPRVRAALAYNLEAAKLSRQHNDSNILVMGSLFVKPALAKKMARVWLDTAFEGGRHKRRVDLINKIEKGMKI